MREKPLESDWKTFRKRVPQWRERYLSRKNQEIITVLTDEQRTPTEQFWDAKAKMKEESKILETCLDGHSRSKMSGYLSLMYRYGFIGDADLDEFSGELRARILIASRV